MNKNLEAKLSMYQVTHDFVDINNVGAVATARPALGDLNEDLQDAIDAINTQYPLTQTVSLGQTINKRNFRNSVESQATAIANMIYSWNGNPILTGNVRPWIAISNWARLKDEEVAGQAQVIIDYVTEYGIEASLEDYGWVEPAVGPPVVPGTLALINSSIAIYNSITTTPQSTIEQRKAANIILVDLFTAADLLLSQMDAMIYPFQFEAEGGDLYNFWVGYEAARTIIGPAVQHTGIKGLITEALTGVPLQGVKVMAIPTPIPGQTPPAETVIVFTDEFGNYTAYTPKFKNIPYTLVWTKTGYDSVQQTDIFVKLGKKTTMNVILEPTT